MAKNPERCTASDRDVSRSRRKGTITGSRKREHGTAMDSRIVSERSNVRGNAFRRGVHVMNPTCRDRPYAERSCVNRSRENMRRSRSTGGDDRIPFAHSTKQELERARLVSATHWSIEVVTLDPQVGIYRIESFDRRRERAEPRSWKYGEHRVALEERKARDYVTPFRPVARGPCRTFPQPTRLAE